MEINHKLILFTQMSIGEIDYLVKISHNLILFTQMSIGFWKGVKLVTRFFKDVC